MGLFSGRRGPNAVLNEAVAALPRQLALPDALTDTIGSGVAILRRPAPG